MSAEAPTSGLWQHPAWLRTGRSNLPGGDRAANLHQAVQYYEAALRIYTERDFPQGSAMTQNNLGTAWANLPDGDRAANLRQAIQCYEAALRVRTEQDFPREYAETTENRRIAREALDWLGETE